LIQLADGFFTQSALVQHSRNSARPRLPRTIQPLVNVVHALNMTVTGIVAHQSALKNGDLMKIPQFRIYLHANWFFVDNV